MELLLMAAWITFCMTAGWFIGGVLSGSSKFSPEYKFDYAIEQTFPALPEGYRWRVAKSKVTPYHRVNVQKRTALGWKNGVWHVWKKDAPVGDMRIVSRSADDWFRTNGLAAAMGYVLRNNPHLHVRER